MRRVSCVRGIRVAVARQRVLQAFFRGEPDLEVTAHRPTLLLPEEKGRVLDFMLRRFDGQESWFHDIRSVALSPARNSAVLGQSYANLAQGMHSLRQGLRRGRAPSRIESAGIPLPP